MDVLNRVFGFGLLNIKYLLEVVLVGEWIMEVIKRVLKIDFESMEGLILENIFGEVEFKRVEFVYFLRSEFIIF